MATYVSGSLLAVGDVILDRDATADTHPYVVVSRDQWQLTLRNCTSHQNSDLQLIEVKQGDKTGDLNWSGKDSYVVKSSSSLNLPCFRDDSQVVGVPMEVDNGPQVPMLFQGTHGPYWQYVQPTMIVMVPRLVQRYSALSYRKVGTITSGRMAEIVQALSA